MVFVWKGGGGDHFLHLFRAGREQFSLVMIELDSACILFFRYFGGVNPNNVPYSDIMGRPANCVRQYGFDGTGNKFVNIHLFYQTSLSV